MYHYKLFVRYYCAGTPTREIKPIWKTYHQPFTEQLQVQLENDLATNECFCEIERIEYLGQSDEIFNQVPINQQCTASIYAPISYSLGDGGLSTRTYH